MCLERIFFEKGISNIYKSPLTNRYEEDRIAVLHWFQSNGWKGCIDNGNSIEILLEALLPDYKTIMTSIDSLYSVTEAIETKKDHNGVKYDDGTLKLLTAELENLNKFLMQIDSEYINSNLNTIKRETLKKRINSILRKRKSENKDWRHSLALIMALFDSLEISKLGDFSLFFIKNKKKLENKYCHLPGNWTKRNTGWPFIIIHKNELVQFVSIKRTKIKSKKIKNVERFCIDILEPYGFRTGFIEISQKVTKDFFIKEEKLFLNASTEHKNGWISPLDRKLVGTEKVVYDYFNSKGWQGTIGEGDLIFMLFRCMCFRNVPDSVYDFYSANNHNSDIECLNKREYGHNIFTLFLNDISGYNKYAKRDWGKLSDRLNDIENITLEEIENNFQTFMCGNLSNKNSNGLLSGFTKETMGGFSLCFERKQLIELAKLLSIPENTYKFSFGWPDLTLFKDGEVIFREIKARSDKLRENQEQLFSEILQPLGFDVSIIRLLPISRS